MQLEETTIRTGRIALHAVEAGPPDGPLVVLLHGFPEFWYGWRGQIGALAGAGYRVLAPDQRGYGRSDKPRGVGAYRLDLLAADVVGLIAARGRDRAAIVGHDWGGAVGWWLALKHPSWIDRLAILNMPHPAVLAEQLRRDPAQRAMSWYILFFQLPWLPEAALRARDWAGATGALVGSGRPGLFSAADLDRYREAWSQPGAIGAMLNWYRAAVRRPSRLPRDPRIAVPTLLLWGARDVALSRAMAGPSIELCDRGRLVLFEEATHWLQHEEAGRVNDFLIDFLGD